MTGWSEERIAVLKRLHADGRSGTEIASALGGVTRNAVLGKIHRLGLAASPEIAKQRSKTIQARLVASSNIDHPRRKRTRAAVEEIKANSLAAAEPELTELIELDAPSEISTCRVSILDLTEQTCRFPSGSSTDGEQMYCGRQPLFARPYCAQCCSRAYLIHGQGKPPSFWARDAKEKEKKSVEIRIARQTRWWETA